MNPFLAIYVAASLLSAVIAFRLARRETGFFRTERKSYIPQLALFVLLVVAVGVDVVHDSSPGEAAFDGVVWVVIFGPQMLAGAMLVALPAIFAGYWLGRRNRYW